MKVFLLATALLGLSGIAQASRMVDYDLTNPLSKNQQLDLGQDLNTAMHFLLKGSQEVHQKMDFSHEIEGFSIALNRDQTGSVTLKARITYPAPSFKNALATITISRTSKLNHNHAPDAPRHSFVYKSEIKEEAQK